MSRYSNDNYLGNYHRYDDNNPSHDRHGSKYSKYSDNKKNSSKYDRYGEGRSRYERYGDRHSRRERSRDRSRDRSRSRSKNESRDRSDDSHLKNGNPLDNNGRGLEEQRPNNFRDRRKIQSSSVDNFNKGNEEIKKRIDEFLKVVKQNNCFLDCVEKFRVHLEAFFNDIDEITNTYHLRPVRGKETLTAQNRRWLIEIAVNTLNSLHDPIFGEWERIIRFKLDPSFSVQRIENKVRKKLISKRMIEYVFTEPKLYAEISEPLLIKQGLLHGLLTMGKEIDFHMKSNSFKEKLAEIKSEMMKVLECNVQDDLDDLFRNGFPLFDTSLDEDNHLYDLFDIKKATWKFFDIPVSYGDGTSTSYGIDFKFPDPEVHSIVETFASGGPDQIYYLDRLFAKCLASPDLKDEVVQLLETSGHANIAEVFLKYNMGDCTVDTIFPEEFNAFATQTYPPEGHFDSKIHSERIKKISNEGDFNEFLKFLNEFKSKKEKPVSTYITFKCGREFEMASVLSYLLVFCEKVLYFLDIKAIKHERMNELLEAIFNNDGLLKIMESPLEYRVLFGHYSYCLNLKTPSKLHFLSYMLLELHTPEDDKNPNPFIEYSDRYLDLIAGANELYIPGGDTKDKKFLLTCFEENSVTEVRKIKRQMNNALTRILKAGISFPSTVKFILGKPFDRTFAFRTEWHRRPILTAQESYMVTEIKALYDCVHALSEYAKSRGLHKKIFSIKNISFSSVDDKEYGKYISNSLL
uniref:ANK_REP_REGION domain-containing protein n=1 Tax=Strongyloides venezuelensis TaxID=75913 RepID=A0A0K0FQU2_STRVS